MIILTLCLSDAAATGSQRREVLQFAALTALSPLFTTPAAFAEKAPKGFVPVKDNQDAYSFLYPFGWQEVGIDGQDVVYKDVIEPLESVSVNLVPTEKKDVAEFGNVKEVCFTLADKVLTSPSQEVNLIKAEEVGEHKKTFNKKHATKTNTDF